MPLDRDHHPWIHAAESIDPQPMPSLAKWDPITFNNGDGSTRNMVMLTVATPSGVMSIFIEPEQLGNIVEQGQAILKLWKENESPLIIARTPDMKRAVREQSLMSPNGHSLS